MTTKTRTKVVHKNVNQYHPKSDNFIFKKKNTKPSGELKKYHCVTFEVKLHVRKKSYKILIRLDFKQKRYLRKSGFETYRPKVFCEM